MFGYLNLNDPSKIGNDEAQEALNCRVDRGYLEYQEWSIDETINRAIKDFMGRSITVDASFGDGPLKAWPEHGHMLRDMGSGVMDNLGSPIPYYVTGWNPGSGAGNTPRIQAFAYGSQPYPIATYSYAITLYDNVTGEEGYPHFFSLAIGTNQVAQFENFPAVGADADFSSKTGIEWRIYRKPIGGSEYLLTLSGSALQAYTANAGPHQDVTADADLGSALDSTMNYMPVVFTVGQEFTHIAEHNGKLFFVQYDKPSAGPGADLNTGDLRTIFYSRTNMVGAIPTSNWFTFQDKITNMFTLAEAFVVLTAKGIYIIYGNDEDDFITKRINDSGIGAGMLGAAVVDNALYFIGSNAGDDTSGDGVFRVVGNELQKVSYKIDTLFPVLAFDIGLVGYPEVFGAGVLENRFFIVRYNNGSENKKLILDTATNGFLRGDDSGVFTYQSKDFGRPGPWDDMTRAFVRGVGDFTLELYGDGEKIDEIAFSFADDTTQDFTVPPQRHYKFSFKFIGQQNAKIYEFGRFE